MISRWQVAVLVLGTVVGATGAATAAPPDSTHPGSAMSVVPVVPDADWEVAPLPSGIDQAAIDTATDAAFGLPDAETRVQSVVVVHGGRIVYERYHPLDGPDTIFHSFSVSKGFVSAVIGMLVDDGLLVLDAPAPVAAWQTPDDPRRTITPGQLLQMSSGLAGSADDGGAMAAAPDVVAAAAMSAVVGEPGSVFQYSSVNTALLIGVARDALGGCDALSEYLRQRLIDPVGITTLELLTDDQGCWLGFMGANMTTRDFARFGLLYARDGAWGDQTIVTPTWIDETRVSASTNENYGLHWWLDPTASLMWLDGLLGQLVVVVPDADLVIAINAAGGDSGALANAILNAFGV